MSMVENYSKSIEIKKQQLESLEAAVEVASNLFQNARIEYIDVLFAQRDLRDARMVLIDTKKEQLSAIVNTYQALGGGVPADLDGGNRRDRHRRCRISPGRRPRPARGPARAARTSAARAAAARAG